MQWAAVAAGAPAGLLTRPFDYCDLGCGNGSTLCLLAACYPEARFVGIDINAAHVELGRERAARAGIGNVRFVHASFADLESLDLPGLDYITAYGVYSWLSPDLQASVAAFARQRLRSGGLLALHYSSLPGSAIRDPLNFYLRALANAPSGGSAARFAGGLAALRKLAPIARFFERNPEAQALLQTMDKAPAAYVAHEVLNGQLHSFYGDELRARFLALGFSCLGSAHVLPDYPELLLSPAAFAAYRQLTRGTDSSFRDAVRDLMLNTSLRFDLFNKSGEASLLAGERLQGLGDLYLHRADVRNDSATRRSWSARSAVDLNGALYSTILDLATAPAVTLREVLASGELRSYPATDVERAIEHLFATGLLNVLVQRPIEIRYRSDRRYRLCSRLNTLWLEETLPSTGAEGIASTVLGSPLLLPPSARWQLMSLLGDDVERLWRASGSTARMSLEQFRGQVRAGMPAFVTDALPELLRLGIVEEDR
jgi:ubiquinone/menaquinone biosynthesis C-methylase UbiE